jgi:hypothetical protein
MHHDLDAYGISCLCLRTAMFKIITTRRQRGMRGIMSYLGRCGPFCLANCFTVKSDPFT